MASFKAGLTYSRSSRDDGDETFSIDSQDKRTLAYAHQHDIYVPEEWMFADEFTGFTLNRPAFNQLLRLAQDRQIDCIIVYKVNRIARKSHLADWFLQEIVFPNNIELHIVEWGRAVKNTKDDLLLFGLQAQFSQFDAMDIKERTMRGRREKVDQGIWMGQGTTVYGYYKEGMRKNTRLFIDYDEAKVVSLIYHLFVTERLPISHIVRFLISEDIPSPSRAKKRFWQLAQWNLESVRAILRDERYTGLFYAYRLQRDGKSLTRKDRELWIPQDFPDLQIIDRETWLYAQQIIDERRDKWSFVAKPGNEYLLSSRQRCLCTGAVGGKSTTKDNGRSYHWYRCQNKAHRRNKLDCTMPSLHVNLVDHLSWQAVESLLRNSEWELELLQKAQAKQKEDFSDSVQALETIEEVTARYNAKLRERYLDWKEGVIPREVYLAEKEDLDRHLQAAKEVARDYQDKADMHILSDSEIRRIVQECRKLADLLDRLGNLEFADKRKFIEAMDITGRYRVDGDMLILDLFVHRIEFESIAITQMPVEQKPGRI